MDVAHISLQGQGHWSICKCDHYLESDLWVWWIDIEGITIKEGRRLIPDYIMFELALADKVGLEFIREMKPLLPGSALDRIEFPRHIPGDSVNIAIPLGECRDVKSVFRVIEEYFPVLSKLIAG